MRSLLLVILAVSCAAGAPGPLAAADRPAAPLVLAPAEWNYGAISQGDVARTVVTVRNATADPLTVTFVPTCDCLSVAPASRLLPAGASAGFDLAYDSRNDTGRTARVFLVRTDRAGDEAARYILRGVVRARGPGAAGGTASPAPGVPSALPPVPLDYWYMPGCRSCEEFLARTLPGLAAARGLALEVRRHDILGTAAYEELAGLVAARGESLRAVPVLGIGAVLLQGETEIQTVLPALLDAAARDPSASRSAPRAGTARPAAAAPAALAALPVIAAGLLDGVNPCAFTTLIFLLASLALAGRRRGEVLAIGALFSLSVFATYFLAGLGLFAALRAAGAVPVVAAVLRWLLAGVLVVLAGLSVYDWTLVRRGRAAEIVLQLPGALKRRIHASIRTRARAAALAASSLALGFLVSVFEFACTGQVYLPTLAWLARTGAAPRALGLLALYNVAFILPLLAVFAAAYAGVSSARITALFQSRMGAVKLGLAAVFAGLAVLTLAA